VHRPLGAEGIPLAAAAHQRDPLRAWGITGMRRWVNLGTHEWIKEGGPEWL